MSVKTRKKGIDLSSYGSLEQTFNFERKCLKCPVGLKVWAAKLTYEKLKLTKADENIFERWFCIAGDPADHRQKFTSPMTAATGG